MAEEKKELDKKANFSETLAYKTVGTVRLTTSERPPVDCPKEKDNPKKQEK